MQLLLLFGLATVPNIALRKWHGSSGGDFSDSSHNKVMEEFLDDFHRHPLV